MKAALGRGPRAHVRRRRLDAVAAAAVPVQQLGLRAGARRLATRQPHAFALAGRLPSPPPSRRPRAHPIRRAPAPRSAARRESLGPEHLWCPDPALACRCTCRRRALLRCAEFGTAGALGATALVGSTGLRSFRLLAPLPPVVSKGEWCALLSTKRMPWISTACTSRFWPIRRARSTSRHARPSIRPARFDQAPVAPPLRFAAEETAADILSFLKKVVPKEICWR